MTTFPPVPVTCDAVRDKCREMLTAALRTDRDHVAIGADCQRLSAQIEECIFRDVGNTDMKYKNRVRSRISNLKDAKNPDLRRNVLCGAITPQQIAVMTSEDMASDELKEIRKAMTKEAIREHQMARTGGTQTDLFTCGKCRKKNCTYTQVQTRSSDEPMTTFVVCNECGNRWKELPEGSAARRAAHQLVEGLRPALHLLGAWRAAAGTRRQVRPGDRLPCSGSKTLTCKPLSRQNPLLPSPPAGAPSSHAVHSTAKGRKPGWGQASARHQRTAASLENPGTTRSPTPTLAHCSASLSPWPGRQASAQLPST
ncbi:transcription elongation factor A2 [Rhinolophus ferrumequinum]|uniref:Transcription elongation factor n=1 Tax=Rhinolophus ferrumequinum TaxID=59479 RepID=A0A7J7S979_RHIFE|nr:transcription elongation factor A2 [Rhinolophus ferrumequinum]